KPRRESGGDLPQTLANKNDVVVDREGRTPFACGLESTESRRNAAVLRLPQNLGELVASSPTGGDVADEHVRRHAVVEIRHLAPDETRIEGGARQAAAGILGQPERARRQRALGGHGPCRCRGAGRSTGLARRA